MQPSETLENSVFPAILAILTPKTCCKNVQQKSKDTQNWNCECSLIYNALEL
jgi:hypothetical protein